MRLGVLRSATGWDVFVPRDVALPGPERVCCVCGGASKHRREVECSPRSWGRPKPDVALALCDSCRLASWRRLTWKIVVVVLTAVVGAGMARLSLLLWAWIPWPAFVAASVAGVGLAWTLGFFIPGRIVRLSGWQGLPARVVDTRGAAWHLQVVSSSVLRQLERVPGVEVRSTELIEHDVTAPAWAGAMTVLAAAIWLWFAWHPVVRLVNTTHEALQISVDGRVVAVLPGLPGETPNAGHEVRVPEGRRVFRAMRLGGEGIDESVGRVEQGSSWLYGPGAVRCFRVERRGYGRAQETGPAAIELPRDRALHAVPAQIDSWFEPNPPAGRDVWFSGGTRVAVRYGDCQQADSIE